MKGMDTKKLILFMFFMTTISGCVRYSYEKISASGDNCSLTITSMREMRLAGLYIDDDCTLIGGGAGMRYNDEAMGAIRDIANKIP